VQVTGFGVEGELREAGPAGREEGAPTAFDSMRRSSACCPARHRRLAGGSKKGKEGKGGGMTTGSHMSDQFFLEWKRGVDGEAVGSPGFWLAFYCFT